eukprot:78661_1
MSWLPMLCIVSLLIIFKVQCIIIDETNPTLEPIKLTEMPTPQPKRNLIGIEPTAMPTPEPLTTPVPTIKIISETTSIPTPEPSETITFSPTVSSLAPTVSPTKTPTLIPTIEQSYCNLLDTRNISTVINIKQNSRISDIEIMDPLIISFDFILDINDSVCNTEENQICNLIQFGVSETYDDTQDISLDRNHSALFPRISTIFQNGQLLWYITIFDGDITTNITNNVNLAQNESFIVPINKQSSFHITFSDNERVIYIDSNLYYYSNSSSNENVWDYIFEEFHPFYISNPYDEPLIGNITNLCISSNSWSPTIFPTKEPSKTPSNIPTNTANPTITPTEYNKINCYTEIGNSGDLTVECSEYGYIITSCGIYDNNITNTSNLIFNKGAYIKRKIVNDLTSDGICYIDFNTQNNSIKDIIRPYARCCNFQKQYNEEFKCRYFESNMIETDFSSGISSSFESASMRNEFTYVSCNSQFPYLLSCITRVYETHPTVITNMANSNNDIQFYGTFQASNAPNDEFNPQYNYYFDLDTQTEKTIPYAPSAPTAPTIENIYTTPSPTYAP